MAFASTDTVLLTEDLGDRKVVRAVPDRPDTFRAQTPQAFRFDTINKAYELAAATPASIRPTTPEWSWTICPIRRSPSWKGPKRTSRSPRRPICRLPKALRPS